MFVPPSPVWKRCLFPEDNQFVCPLGTNKKGTDRHTDSLTKCFTYTALNPDIKWFWSNNKFYRIKPKFENGGDKHFSHTGGGGKHYLLDVLVTMMMLMKRWMWAKQIFLWGRSIGPWNSRMYIKCFVWCLSVSEWGVLVPQDTNISNTQERGGTNIFASNIYTQQGIDNMVRHAKTRNPCNPGSRICFAHCGNFFHKAIKKIVQNKTNPILYLEWWYRVYSVILRGIK